MITSLVVGETAGLPRSRWAQKPHVAISEWHCAKMDVSLAVHAQFCLKMRNFPPMAMFFRGMFALRLFNCTHSGALQFQVSSKLQETLHALNTTYLDLYLLHYPRYSL